MSFKIVDISIVTWDNDCATFWALCNLYRLRKRRSCTLNVTIISFSLLARLTRRFEAVFNRFRLHQHKLNFYLTIMKAYAILFPSLSYGSYSSTVKPVDVMRDKVN